MKNKLTEILKSHFDCTGTDVEKLLTPSQDRDKLVEDIEYIMLERISSDLQYDVGDIAEDIVNHILTSLPTERANEVNEVKPPHNK